MAEKTEDPMLRKCLDVLERQIKRKKREIASLELVMKQKRIDRFKRLLTGADK